jgi:hypothetical protein
MAVLKCLETILKIIMDESVLNINLVQVYRKHTESCVDFYADFLGEVPSASQIKKDRRLLYVTLLSACQSDLGSRILMDNRDNQEVVCSWCQLVQQYETESNKNFRIKRQESVINKVFRKM